MWVYAPLNILLVEQSNITFNESWQQLQERELFWILIRRSHEDNNKRNYEEGDKNPVGFPHETKVS